MEKNCPHCDKHCPADQLHCPRGREYFGIKEEGHDGHHAHSDENMIMLLRKCGHFLHHSVGRDQDITPMLNALTPEERSILEILLKKCLNQWQLLQDPETNR